MVEYTGEDWQKDILSRDWLESRGLVDTIAFKLYKEEYSNEKRREKLLEIPEMKRLAMICNNECRSIDKLRTFIKESEDA